MTGSVSSSFRQGIWMISFMAPGGVKATIAPVMRRLRAEGPALAVLGLMLVVGLVLRVLHNDHGLPYVYYVDEGSHFTKRAVEIFRDANPGYFQNPSAYTYLLHLTYRVIALPFGGGEKVISGYNASAAWIWEISRGLAALLCLVGVAAIYWVGRQLWDRRSGLVAAAVLCFAFLPVAFSRLAVTDVGTLAPVAIVAARVDPDRRGRVVALVPRRRARRGPGDRLQVHGRARPARAGAGDRAGASPRAGDLRAAAIGLAALLAGTLLTFFVTNPYFFLDLDTALHQLRGQAELAGNQDKFGQQGDSGPLYYLDSLGWGFGYVAGLAALAGAVLLARRDRTRLAILLIFPVALFLYLSFQSRFFGRWLLPVYPALALLAGYACMRGLAWVRERIPRWRWAILGVGAALLLWQPLAADARSMAVLGNTDTRAIARQWLVEHSRRDLRVVIEPAVPDRYLFRIIGGRPRNTRDDQFVNEFIRDTREEHVEYGRTLSPGLLDRYRRRGYCTVMTFGLIRGRAEESGDPRGARLLPPARAGVRPALRGQPVPRGRVPAAVQLRPQLQLLLARLRAARAGDADLPAARLPRSATGRRRRERTEPAQRRALARRDPRARARPAALAPAPRAAVRVQRRRGRALRPEGDRDVQRRPRPGLLREPVGAHLPAVPRVQGPLHRGLPVRRRLRRRGGVGVPDRARRRRADRDARRRPHLLGRRALRRPPRRPRRRGA